jgi:HSP20 family protein
MTLAPMISSQHRGRQHQLAPAYRWGPYRDMEDVNERFSRLVRAFFGDTMATTGGGSWAMTALPVDVEETDDAYVVDIDLPNVDPEALNLEIRGEELRLTGAHPERDREGVVRRQDRPSGEFEYMVDLPSDIDPDKIDARYENGVLTIRVGKTRDVQPRRIEIRAMKGENGKQQQGQQQGKSRSTT